MDGSKDAETVEFTYAGSRYEIDLAAKNRKKFDDQMAEWIGHARKSGGAARPAGSGRRSGGQGGKRDPEQLKAIREWGRQNGYPDLGDRGRIPAEVEEKYNAAH